MKKILTLDSSTDACSVALSIGQDVVEDFLICPRQQAGNILKMVDALLSAASLDISMLDAVGVSIGPGSFTGIRIAAGVASGIALAHALPLYGRSTLALMADGCYRELKQQEVLVVLDARMQAFYWGHFRYDTDKAIMVGVEHLTDEQGISWSSQGAWIGTGLKICEPKFDRAVDPVMVLPNQMPHARDIIPYVSYAMEAGLPAKARDLRLNYLRNQVVNA